MPVNGLSLEVWELLKKQWPAGDSPLTLERGLLRVPVYNAIRRDHQDASYVIAENVSFADFRRRLVESSVSK